jgi:hypothetical protein
MQMALTHLCEAPVPAAGGFRLLKARQRSLIDEALQIEQEEARSADAIGFMSRTLAQVTLPHVDPKTLYYERTNGKLLLAVRGHKSYGVPFGTIPRIVLAWMCSEAVRTKSPILELGLSAADFSRKLKMHYNGRDLARLKKQALALARAVISVDGLDAATSALAYEDIKITSRGFVFWSDKNPEQKCIWESILTLTDDFYKSVVTRPVPIDMRALHALSKSPLAMDIYTWLVYRMFVLRVSGHGQALIPWAGLKEQFGNGYADGAKGLNNFKVNFKRRLKEVLEFYREANDHLSDTGEHLKMTPCRLHIVHTKGARLSALSCE